MSGNGPPAHRAAGSVQRNRLIAVGAGLLLALILLFSLLALCTNRPGDDPPPGAAPGSSVQVSLLPSEPGGGPGGTSPREIEPGATSSGGAAAEPSPGTDVPPGTGDPATPATTEPGDEPGTTDPEQTRTPSGGVDTGGGSLVPGRRLALLVTGFFLLLAAGAAGAYALRRPLHHR